jgi:TPR repeat protein
MGLYELGEAEDPNPSLGLYWLQSAADRGHEAAKRYLEENR